MSALVVGTCQHCGDRCDKGSACCKACRWAIHRAEASKPKRFWAKVDADGDCWLWRGHLMRKNYGQFRGFDGKTILAHRQAWLLTYGAIPEGMWVLHACDEPQCVRPEHLFLGTSDDNVADMVAKGRHRGARRRPLGDDHPARKNPGYLLRGSQHPGSVHLTQEQADAIATRASSGERHKALAHEFGVSKATVGRIVQRRHWLCRS